jgi:transposase-like protein
MAKPSGNTRQYTDEYRAEVVVALRVAGYPDQAGALTRVAKQYNLHARTISRWYNTESNPPPDKTVTEKKKSLQSIIEYELYAIFHILPSKRSEADYRQLTTAAAILIDKMQLLNGLPTERHESMNYELTEDERAKRVAQLLDTARDRRDGQVVADEASADPPTA